MKEYLHQLQQQSGHVCTRKTNFKEIHEKKKARWERELFYSYFVTKNKVDYRSLIRKKKAA